ncbi:MAG: c-type cytochrome, partial [Nitrospirota bacterium]|nr:c-type cytochrome [Nitrospirota bacterium]
MLKVVRMKTWRRGAGLALLVAAQTACESNATNPDAAKPIGVATPVDVQAGEAKFSATCAACHGVRGVGTKQGPPLA